MNIKELIIEYLSATYIGGILWFIVLERRETYLKWRILATAFSPLTVPILLVANSIMKIAEWFATRTPKTAKNG